MGIGAACASCFAHTLTAPRFSLVDSDRDVTAVLHEMWSTDAAARPMFEEVRDRLGAVWTGKPFHGEPNAAYIDL